MKTVKYIEIERIKSGWLFNNWTNVMQRELHHYFDAHLIEMRNKFIRVEGKRIVYYILGVSSEYEAKQFAIWYHTKPHEIKKISLLD